MQGLAALRTGGMLTLGRISPICGATRQRQVFEHTGTHSVEPRVEFGFDFAQSRLGVLEAPFAHSCHNLLS
jgi:hypothetical protein